MILKEIHFIEDSDDEAFLSGLLLRKDKLAARLIHHPFLKSFTDVLARLPHDEPMLALFDLNMPGIKGTEAIRHVRAEDRKNLIMGICTGSEDPADEKLALQSGANFFISKPLNMGKIVSLCSAVKSVVLRERPDGLSELVYLSNAKTGS